MWRIRAPRDSHRRDEVHAMCEEFMLFSIHSISVSVLNWINYSNRDQYQGISSLNWKHKFPVAARVFQLQRCYAIHHKISKHRKERKCTETILYTTHLRWSEIKESGCIRCLRVHCWGPARRPCRRPLRRAWEIVADLAPSSSAANTCSPRTRRGWPERKRERLQLWWPRQMSF